MTQITLYLHGQGITTPTARAHCAWIKAVTGLVMTPLFYHDLFEEAPVQLLGLPLKAPSAAEEERQLAHYFAELDADIDSAQRLPAREITRAHLFETHRSALRYLSRQELAGQVRTNLVEQIEQATTSRPRANSPVTLVVHSLGSVIALDLLRDLPAGVRVDRLVTLGSPLGLIASVPGPAARSLLPPELREVGIPWFDFAAEGDVLATIQRVSRRRQFDGRPLTVSTIQGDFDNPHESYFIDPPVALAWTSACR